MDCLGLIHGYLREVGPLRFSLAGHHLSDFEKSSYWLDVHRLIFFPRSSFAQHIAEFGQMGPWHQHSTSWYVTRDEIMRGVFVDVAKLRRLGALVDMLSQLEDALPPPSESLAMGIMRSAHLLETPEAHQDIGDRYGASVVLNWQMVSVPLPELAVA
jgi:hypothetical protein